MEKAKARFKSTTYEVLPSGTFMVLENTGTTTAEESAFLRMVDRISEDEYAIIRIYMENGNVKRVLFGLRSSNIVQMILDAVRHGIADMHTENTP